MPPAASPRRARCTCCQPTAGSSIPRARCSRWAPGTPAFYCAGSFEVTVPTGGVRVLVERGTEYVPLERNLTVTENQNVDLELPLQRWTHFTERGWYPGNTHIHYDEKEQQRDRRLELEGHVHDFSVTVVSVLRRWDLDYASNHFPIGVMTDLSTAHHVLDIGEENRHNFHGGEIGYGHVMFLRIRNLVEPVSRGMLVDSLDPDYPPICHACDEAREQDGIVLWCHNGRGLEAPVAAALGKLDGFNLFDPFWMDPEYEIWYRLLNCGIPLPASTGSDWFVCSNNRVYVDLGGAAFEYDRWIDGLKAGRTFITNGPLLLLRADGAAPGDTLQVQPEQRAGRWRWSWPAITGSTASSWSPTAPWCAAGSVRAASPGNASATGSRCLPTAGSRRAATATCATATPRRSSPTPAPSTCAAAARIRPQSPTPPTSWPASTTRCSAG